MKLRTLTIAPGEPFSPAEPDSPWLKHMRKIRWAEKWNQHAGLKILSGDCTLAPAAPVSPLAPSRPGWPYKQVMTGQDQKLQLCGSDPSLFKCREDFNTHSVSFNSRKSRSSREPTSSLKQTHTLRFRSTFCDLTSDLKNWNWIKKKKPEDPWSLTWGPAGPRSPGLPGLPDSPWKVKETETLGHLIWGSNSIVRRQTAPSGGAKSSQSKV